MTKHLDAQRTQRNERLASRRFNATRLPSLPEGTHTDPGQPGLQLRVRALGTPDEKPRRYSRAWLLRFKFRKEETRILIGHFPETSLDAARGEARRLRELADQGIDPRTARPRRRERPTPRAVSAAPVGGRHSIEFLADEFLERYVRPSRKRPEYAEAILNRDVLPLWRGRDARTIDPGEVIELLDGIVDRGSPVQANRTAALIGQMFKFGIQRRIVTATPVQLLMRPGGKEKPRKRLLSDDELRAFLSDPKGCTRFDRLTQVITLLLLTGQRRGELASARWADIDFKARTWTIPEERSKSGQAQLCPLTDWAIDELRVLQRKAQGSQWVLPADDQTRHLDPKQLTRSLARCLDRFRARKIAAFTLHDLRRTCRTGLSRLKVAPHIAERVLNHAQKKLAETYDLHEYADEKRAALEKWTDYLRGLSR